MKSSKTIVEEYLKKNDWRVKENSNSPFSFGALNKYITSEVSKDDKAVIKLNRFKKWLNEFATANGLTQVQ